MNRARRLGSAPGAVAMGSTTQVELAGARRSDTAMPGERLS
jgi:hypothetical protein